MKLSEKYVYKVYHTKSFSKAANELYISQPSLSATIKKLEAELGFSIFDRSKAPIALTPEGEIYIEYLEDSLENEKKMHQRIMAASTRTNETLSIGGTSFFARTLFPKACGEFHRRFPNVKLMIDLGEVGYLRNLFDKLDQGTLELMITYIYDTSKFDGVPLLDERYIIAMRQDFHGANKLLPYALTRDEILSGSSFPEREISDYSLFENICFLRVGKTGSIYQDMSELIEQLTMSPCYIHNFRKFDIAYDMMLEGIGAIITTDFLIAARPERSDEVLYFITHQKNMRRAMIIYKKDKSLSKRAQEFISIAREISQTRNKLFP